MFKEAEKGAKDINIERTEEVLNTGAEIVAAACPFCLTMLSDGIKAFEKESDVKVIDLLPGLAELNKNNDFYWKLNPHFNVKGSEVVGEIIYNELIERKIILNK